MQKIYITLLSGMLLLLGAVNAFAGALQETRVTLESGRFDLAVEQGSNLGTSDGLALAAEALNAKLLLGQAERKTKTAKQAMKLAQAALALEPKNAEAQLQYALAYGFYGRHASSFKAWRKNLPKKIRIEIDKAAALAPEDMRVEALKGAWHLNLLYRASGFDVEKRYGANKEQGIKHFKNALVQHGDDIIIQTTYLMLNYILEPEQQAEDTKASLQKSLLSLKPKNAVERQILKQMQGVYAGFQTGNALELAEAFVNQ